MSEFAAIALLALSPGDSLPAALYSVDDGRVAYTVAEYMDTTVTAWRLGPGVAVEAVIEDLGPGEVLVLLVPRAGEDQSTGVAELPPSPEPDTPGTGCGRIFSWR